MSVMERRLQLLLDARRYELVSKEAQRSGRSVAAVIREAIDLRFTQDDTERRMRAARALLDMTATPESTPGEGPAELKVAYAANLDRALS